MFDWSIIRPQDVEIAKRYLGDLTREPDLKISPLGEVYLYRWHIIPRNPDANVYFHIQVASDPERPLHDHPWDNQSVILAGGYQEIIRAAWGDPSHEVSVNRFPGDVITRRAADAHRLILPAWVKYSMTQFTTGPVVRDWGFYTGKGFIPFSYYIEERDGVSTLKDPHHD